MFKKLKHENKLLCTSKQKYLKFYYLFHIINSISSIIID